MDKDYQQPDGTDLEAQHTDHAENKRQNTVRFVCMVVSDPHKRDHSADIMATVFSWPEGYYVAHEQYIEKNGDVYWYARLQASSDNDTPF